MLRNMVILGQSVTAARVEPGFVNYPRGLTKTPTWYQMMFTGPSTWDFLPMKVPHIELSADGVVHKIYLSDLLEWQRLVAECGPQNGHPYHGFIHGGLPKFVQPIWERFLDACEDWMKEEKEATLVAQTWGLKVD